jgi:hypothetical protein
VGDFINIGNEVLQIAGPGAPESEPASSTWQLARAQHGTQAASAAEGSTVYRLAARRIHFVFPPGYTLAHPTLDLANGEYYVQRFRPGRLRILHAALTFTGLGGASQAVSRTFALTGAFEPDVAGTLPGLRTSAGGLGTLQVLGPLTTGSDLVMPLILPYGVSIGIVYAAVEKAPTGQPIRLQLKLDGENFGPVAEIPAWISGEPAGTGVFLSGAQRGNVGGQALGLEILQAGSGDPGEGLTVYVTV